MQGLKATLLICFLMTATAFGGPVPDPAGGEKRAREDLSKLLLRLSQALDMKEATYEESKGGGGKSFDSNSGNSFLSNTTIHYYVQSTCQEWVGGQFCNSWLDPYIPEHGFGKDHSPLEGTVAQEWKQRQTIDSGSNYKIWQVERQGGGPNTDADGKFDYSGITDWQLLPEVRQKIEQVGEQTAARQIALTSDDNAPKNGAKYTMPNMESLRMMASRWTKMFRNRLVANLAEMRSGDKPTEFLLNEDRPDCESYQQAMQKMQEQTKTEERLEPQARLDMETLAMDLQTRYKSCVALRSASVNMVNATSSGGQVSEGDVEQERVDKWKTRLNIALIDRVGIDPNDLPKPSNGKISRRDISSELAEWSEGGEKIKRKRRLTNAQQLQSYNNQLELAAVGMEEVAMRSPNIANNGSFIKKHKIKPGQYNAIKLNSLTPEMREELADTSMKQSSVMKGTPENKLEDNAAQLSVTRR